jgi:hypothetical protein
MFVRHRAAFRTAAKAMRPGLGACFEGFVDFFGHQVA